MGDAYAQRQTDAAVAWVRGLPAGYPPRRVEEAACERFGIGGDPDGLLEEKYEEATQPVLDYTKAWLEEHGPRWNDDEQGDLAEAAAKFGIIPEHAETMVAAFDTRQRDAAVESVKQLLAAGTPRVRVLQQTIKDWAGTRYIGAALETLAAQEQKTPQQRAWRTRTQPLEKRFADSF